MRRRTGAVLSAELVIVLAITVVGAVWGLSALRDALNAELVDLARFFRSL